MRRRVLLVLSLLASWAHAKPMEVDEGGEIKRTGNAGLSEAFNRTINLDRSTSLRIAYPNARFLYIQFSKFDLPHGASLTLTTNESTVMYTGKGKSHTAHDTAFYSDRLVGSAVDIVYKRHHDTSKTHGFGITISSYIRGIPRVDLDTKSALTNPACVNKRPVWRPAVCFQEEAPRVFESSRALARMVTLGASSQYATGFLAGCDGYFLTNEHNVRTQEQVDATDFGFLAASARCDDTCNHLALGCAPKLLLRGAATLVAVDTTLDYTLLRFDHAARRQFQALGVPHLPLRHRSRAVVGETIYIVQHPDGTAAKIVTQLRSGSDAVVSDVDVTNKCGKHQVGYAAETIGGASGSPVLATRDHRVIGLHHCGECNVETSTEGAALRTAIPIHDILADLKKKRIDLPACFTMRHG
ncbi:Aste57867_13903 [Aphanomyces stellatus]|uniref:Aste57867_13903 protein n=1 Tax=Aphanomyces stellatus TaxID=120398 RepID=A0A485L0Z8_9STRA|nr:hypothetical protein As57867_013852 [Aphanomyces stellatus]VFT90734.1 Aste57867_13903 [Aphanomyces stellatus]